MLKVYMLIVVLGLVGGVVYGGYYYYKDTQTRIQTLTKNSAKLETAAKLQKNTIDTCLLYTSPSPRDRQKSRMPSSA